MRGKDQSERSGEERLSWADERERKKTKVTADEQMSREITMSRDCNNIASGTKQQKL